MLPQPIVYLAISSENQSTFDQPCVCRTGPVSLRPSIWKKPPPLTGAALSLRGRGPVFHRPSERGNPCRQVCHPAAFFFLICSPTDSSFMFCGVLFPAFPAFRAPISPILYKIYKYHEK